MIKNKRGQALLALLILLALAGISIPVTYRQIAINQQAIIRAPPGCHWIDKSGDFICDDSSFGKITLKNGTIFETYSPNGYYLSATDVNATSLSPSSFAYRWISANGS